VSPVPDPCALVYARRFDLDSGWQAIESVSGKHYESIMTSRVAGIDRHGSIWAAWTHVAPELGSPGAWLSRYTPGQGWSQPQSLTSNPVGYFGELAMAVSPQGRMFMAWRESSAFDEIIGKAFC
jgi:hypothetical protein